MHAPLLKVSQGISYSSTNKPQNWNKNHQNDVKDALSSFKGGSQSVQAVLCVFDALIRHNSSLFLSKPSSKILSCERTNADMHRQNVQSFLDMHFFQQHGPRVWLWRIVLLCVFKGRNVCDHSSFVRTCFRQTGRRIRGTKSHSDWHLDSISVLKASCWHLYHVSLSLCCGQKTSINLQLVSLVT